MDEPHFYFYYHEHKAELQLYAHHSKPATMYIELRVEDEKDKKQGRPLKRTAFRGFIIADFAAPPDMTIFGDGKPDPRRPERPTLCIRLETMTGSTLNKFRDFDVLVKWLLEEYLASEQTYRGLFMIVD